MDLQAAAELGDAPAGGAPSADVSRRPLPPLRHLTPGWGVAAICIALMTWVLATLGRDTLWLDEAFTIANSRTGVLDIARLNGGSMLGYYALMNPIAWAAETPVPLRLPSLLAIVALIPAFYALARRLLLREAAAVATLALALNPWTIGYAREARPYAFVLLFSVLSWHTWLLSLDDPRGTTRWMWTLVSAAGCYSHLLFVLHLPSQVLVAWAHPRRRVSTRRLVTPVVVLAALTAPLAVYSQHPDAGDPDWVRPLSATVVGDVLKRLFGVETFVPLGILILLLAALSVRTVLDRDAESGSAHHRLVPLLWFVGGVVGLAVVSLYKPLFVERYLVIVLPALALLVGQGVTVLARRSRWAPAAIATMLVVSSLPHWNHRTTHEEWSWVSARVASAPHDVGVVVAMERYRTPIDVYLEWQDLDVAAIAASPDDAWGQPRRVYHPSDEWPPGMREVWLVWKPGRPTETTELVGRIRASGFGAPEVEWAPNSDLAIVHFRQTPDDSI